MQQNTGLDAYSSGRSRFFMLITLLAVLWPFAIVFHVIPQLASENLSDSALIVLLAKVALGLLTWLVLWVAKRLVISHELQHRAGAFVVLGSTYLTLAVWVYLNNALSKTFPDSLSEPGFVLSFGVLFLLPLLHSSNRFFYIALVAIGVFWTTVVGFDVELGDWDLMSYMVLALLIMFALVLNHNHIQRYETLLQEMLAAANSEISTVVNLASQDRMTGLLNRQSFLDRLEHQILRYKGEDGGLMFFFDMDKFKAINDTYGHEAGDKAILAFASVLKTELRNPADMAARFGGDEFYLVLGHIKPELVNEVVERVTHKINNMWIMIDDTRIKLKASGGMVVLNQKTVIKRALIQVDKLLYASKKNTPGHIKTRFSLEEA